MTEPQDNLNQDNHNTVSVDLADLVAVLTEEKAELAQQVSMLKAAVRKLQRERGEQPEQPALGNGVAPRERVDSG